MGQPTFNSIQPRTRFQLQTSQPGRVYYEVKQIGDAAYPLSKTRDLVIPPSERLLFEQQVFMRPTARFRNRNRLVYCLHDALVPLDSSSSDGFVRLEGTPPFTLVLSIKNIGASHVEMRTIEAPTSSWRLNIPSYTFSSIGPHLITIQKVTDSSSCEQAAFDPLLRSIWIDVAETASIIPFERREDICVGDVTQFQLEGIPPWTIGSVNFSLSKRRFQHFYFLSLVTMSMASLSFKKPKPLHSRFFNNSLDYSRLLASHINRKCARLLWPIFDSKCMRFPLRKSGMERRYSKTSTKATRRRLYSRSLGNRLLHLHTNVLNSRPRKVESERSSRRTPLLAFKLTSIQYFRPWKVCRDILFY